MLVIEFLIQTFLIILDVTKCNIVEITVDNRIDYSNLASDRNWCITVLL